MSPDNEYIAHDPYYESKKIAPDNVLMKILHMMLGGYIVHVIESIAHDVG